MNQPTTVKTESTKLMMITKDVKVKIKKTYTSRDRCLFHIEETMVHLINDEILHQEILLLIQPTRGNKDLNVNKR